MTEVKLGTGLLNPKLCLRFLWGGCYRAKDDLECFEQLQLNGKQKLALYQAVPRFKTY